ncbi:MAG: hypothetical protein ACRDFB_00765 [Rhabdochlamydiaceae bacterium]
MNNELQKQLEEIVSIVTPGESLKKALLISLTHIANSYYMQGYKDGMKAAAEIHKQVFNK